MLERKQHVFSTGNLYVTPLYDHTGATIANPTPRLAGTLQDVSVDFSREIKKLKGQHKFPSVIAPAGEEIKGTAKVANINAGLVNAIFFNQPITNGVTAVKIDTTGTAIPESPGPYTITVAPPSSGTYSADLGVVNSATGARMTRVSATPATGQYSVDTETGTYTFASADAEKVVLIDYEYTADSATAPEIAVDNSSLIGTGGGFKLHLYTPFKGDYMTLILYYCVSSSFKMAFKNDDFMIPDLSFECGADESGMVYKWATSKI